MEFRREILGRVGLGLVRGPRLLQGPRQVRPRLLEHHQLPDRRPQRPIDGHLVAMAELPLLRPVAVRRLDRAAAEVGRLGDQPAPLAEPLDLLGHRKAQGRDRRLVLGLGQREDDHAEAVVEDGLAANSALFAASSRADAREIPPAWCGSSSSRRPARSISLI